MDQELVAASIPDETGAYWVTPELAGYWLSRNTENRPLRESRVLTMARDMANEAWCYTGEAIKFSVNNRLVDGQHRLHAVIRCGVTIKMLVVKDVPEEAQAFMDAGAKRTAGDALSFRGESNANLLASTVRFAVGFEANLSKSNLGISHAAIIDWLTEHPTIRRQIGFTARHAGKIDMKPSVFAYALYRLDGIDHDDAEKFASDVVNMRSTGNGDPIYTLLQRFRTARKHRERLASITELSFVFRAWNAWRDGTPLKLLKIPADTREVVQPK